mgnify:CR=1 FL=1
MHTEIMGPSVRRQSVNCEGSNSVSTFGNGESRTPVVLQNV